MRVMSVRETWEALASGQSIARYDDGEVVIMQRKSIPFQKRSYKLAGRLKSILGASDIIIGIPPIDQYMRGEFGKSRESYINCCMNLEPLLREGYTYGNALASRMDALDQSEVSFVVHKFREMINNRHVVLVASADVTNDLQLFESVSRLDVIPIPSEHAWAEYADIFERSSKVALPDSVVLISAGPTATVLAHELHRVVGCQAVDMGNFWVTLKRRAGLLAPLAERPGREIESRTIGIWDADHERSQEVVMSSAISWEEIEEVQNGNDFALCQSWLLRQTAIGAAETLETPASSETEKFYRNVASREVWLLTWPREGRPGSFERC